MNNIAAVLQYGGVSGNSGYGKDGVADFVYIAYGASSEGETTSAYVYSGFYEGTFFAGGTFDQSKISVQAVAEIIGVTEGDYDSSVATSASMVTTNPFG